VWRWDHGICVKIKLKCGTAQHAKLVAVKLGSIKVLHMPKGIYIIYIRPVRYISTAVYYYSWENRDLEKYFFKIFISVRGEAFLRSIYGNKAGKAPIPFC
jgi:hypothetical protein